MASRAANAAVVQYRRNNRVQRKAESEELLLNQMVSVLTPEEFDDYMVMTQEIDRAVNALPDGTSEATLRSVELRAGLDRGGLT